MLDQEIRQVPNLTKEAVETKNRLIDAAEELFAQKGFDGTSIRDITNKAERNHAAVNYFFGDKQMLYQELFRNRLSEMRETRLNSIKEAMSYNNEKKLENLLHLYAVAFLEPFTDRGRNMRFLQLFARELVEQRLPKTMFIEEMVRPVMNALEDALLILCPSLQKRDVQNCIHSLVGQLVHVAHVNAMFESIQGEEALKLSIEEAIGHIVKFSAAGIRAFAKEK